MRLYDGIREAYGAFRESSSRHQTADETARSPCRCHHGPLRFDERKDLSCNGDLAHARRCLAVLDVYVSELAHRFIMKSLEVSKADLIGGDTGL